MKFVKVSRCGLKVGVGGELTAWDGKLLGNVSYFRIVGGKPLWGVRGEAKPRMGVGRERD